MSVKGAQNISFTSELILELSERGGGGRPGLPVPNSPYGLCGRKAALKQFYYTSERGK